MRDGKKGSILPVRWLFLLLACWCFLPSLVQASARVETVTAVVEADSGMPPLVQQRMETSVRVIAEQLLLGRSTADVAADSQAQAEVIRQVFDKVLVGYTVRAVDIDTGQTTRVTAYLQPWSDVIRRIEVDTSVEGMPPGVEKLVRQDLDQVDGVFSDALSGLPVAATDWTNGVLKHHLNDFLSEHLPEFRADFDVDTDGDTATVHLTVYPRLPVVRTVDLSMRSDTIPNMTLLNHRQLMQEHVDQLVGVPVAFVARHKDAFAGTLAAELDAQPDFKALHMKSRVDIAPAERMQVMSRSDTDRYRLRLTGWLDIDRKDDDAHDQQDNLRFRLHAGRMIGPRDEWFLQFDFMPQDVNWGWETGYARRIGIGTEAQLRYDMRRKRIVLGAAQQLAPRWRLRYEYRFADQMGEAGLIFKVHDFLNLEYVRDARQGWLRVLGNF